jgi:hypothetical protein
MADTAVASQLQQWTFEKRSIATRPERSGSNSTASSPILCDNAPETLRIETAANNQPSSAPRKESIALQERYMSSEEALSPADDGSDSEYDYDYDHVIINDPAKESKARTMSISRWDKGRSCDMAVMVSYAFVGRPKVVELDCRSPTIDLPPVQQRSASLANLPITAISQLRKDAAQRLSMKVPATRPPTSPQTRAPPPPVELESRRPSTSYSPSTRNTSILDLTDSASASSSFRTATSTRSISPAVDELLARPTLDITASARSSVYIPSQTRHGLARTQTTQSYWTPPTPSSPASHAFLSSDPYETSNKDSASPIIKPAPHKRLRSISMKLALAKIAIGGPSKKTYDTRVNGKAPPTPSTPYTPLTPQTAPLEGSSSFISPQKLRRASTILRPKSRGRDSMRGPSPEFAPPVPTINPNSLTSSLAQKRMTVSKMQARGANEREPTLVIPPCPSDTDDDPMASFKSRKLKKRKSLMSLMDAL